MTVLSIIISVKSGYCLIILFESLAVRVGRDCFGRPVIVIGRVSGRGRRAVRRQATGRGATGQRGNGQEGGGGGREHCFARGSSRVGG